MMINWWRAWQARRYEERFKQGFGYAMAEHHVGGCDTDDLVQLADEMMDGEEHAFAEGVLMAVEVING